MNEHWSFVSVLVEVADPTQEVKEGRGMSGNSKIRPGDEVEQANLLRLICHLLKHNK